MINIGLGLDKADGAVDYFSDGFTVLLKTKKNEALRKMMLSSVGQENAGLVDALEREEFMNKELSLATCDGIASYNLGEYSAQKDVAISSCKKVASKVLAEEKQPEWSQMRDSLESTLFHMLDKQMEHIVNGDVVQHASGALASGAANKLLEMLAKARAKEQEKGFEAVGDKDGPFVSKEAQEKSIHRTAELEAEATAEKISNMGAGSEEAKASQPTKTGKPANDNAAAPGKYSYSMKIIHAKKPSEDGTVKNNIGHFFTIITKTDSVTGQTEDIVFDKNPTKDNTPVTRGSKVSSFADIKESYMEEELAANNYIEKQIKITEAAFNEAKAYKTSSNEEARPYIGTIDDCITVAQKMLVIAGRTGDIGDLFTADDIKKMNSLAADSMVRRYGLEGAELLVARPFSNSEQVAKEFNVPVERVEKLAPSFMEDSLMSPNYKIVPPNEK